MEGKTCSRCHCWQPFNRFSLSRKTSDGRQSACKACVAIWNAEFYAANRDRERARSRADKASNRARNAATTAAWRAANLDHYISTQVAWRAAHAEEISQRRKANHANNRDRELARNAKWKRDNPHRVAAAIARRTATKLLATPAWADHATIEKIYEQASRVSAVTGVPHHVDHIVPLQSAIVCGLHCEANLQIMMASQNQSKSNRSWPDMPEPSRGAQ